VEGDLRIAMVAALARLHGSQTILIHPSGPGQAEGVVVGLHAWEPLGLATGVVPLFVVGDASKDVYGIGWTGQFKEPVPPFLGVLLIDGDPQSNATSGLGWAPGAHGTLYDVLGGAPAADCVRPTGEPGLSLLPACRDLAGAGNRRDKREGKRQAGPRRCEPPAAAHGNTTVLLRFGTWPTGMRATSLISCVSTTETSFDPALATYR